jgi:hypothetical protein
MESTKLEGEALIAAHRETVRKLTIAGIVFPLLVIAIITVQLMGVVSRVENADVAAIANTSAQRLSSVWPEVEAELAKVAAAVEPALGDAIKQEASSMAPQLEQRLETDVTRLTESAQEDFRMAVDGAIAELDAQQRAALLAELPELADNRAAQDQVLAVSRERLALWSAARFDSTLEDHVEAIGAIRKTLAKSYTAPDTISAEPEDALVVWLELLNERIGGEELLAVAEKHDDPPSKKRGKAGGKP